MTKSDREYDRYDRDTESRNNRHTRRERRNAGWESFERPRLTRSVEQRWIGGVCGGLAEYWGAQAWVVRLVAFIGTLFFPNLLLPAYIIAWILVPRQDDDRWRRRSRRPDVSSHDAGAPEFGGRHAFRKSLRTLQRAFREIDRRIRRLEEAVTDPSYGVRREFRKLDD